MALRFPFFTETRRERFYVANREREMSIGTGGHNLYIRFTSRTNNRFRKKF